MTFLRVWANDGALTEANPPGGYATIRAAERAARFYPLKWHAPLRVLDGETVTIATVGAPLARRGRPPVPRPGAKGDR